MQTYILFLYDPFNIIVRSCLGLPIGLFSWDLRLDIGLYTNIKNIVKDLINALRGNSSVNKVKVQQWKMCLSGRMLFLVARQQHTNEYAG
jgi:hypothetical protein